MRDAAHRRHHWCAITEDLACSGFNLHPAAFCSWVERGDAGGESCAVLLCCAVLLPPFVLLVYVSTEVTEIGVLLLLTRVPKVTLPRSGPESYKQKNMYVLGQTSA